MKLAPAGRSRASSIRSNPLNSSDMLVLHLVMPWYALLELVFSIGGEQRGKPGFQFQPFGFARRRVRHLFAEQDHFGTLRERQARSAKVQQLRGRKRGFAVSRDHVGRDFLSVVPILKGHRHGKFHPRMPLQEVVDLQRRNIDAPANDEFLEPARDKEEWSSLFVACIKPFVPRAEPTPL